MPQLPQFVNEVNGLPHNIEVEQAVLGAMLIQNTTAEKMPALRAEHFFDPIHQELCAVILDVIASGRTANPFTLKGACEHLGRVGDYTAVQYLGRLAASPAVTLHGVEEYAGILANLAQRRALIAVGQQMIADASDQTSSDPRQAIEDAEQALFAVTGSDEQPSSADFSAVVDYELSSSMDAYRNGGRTTGLSTGLLTLDARLGGGLEPGNLVIIGGRPGMGKSALAVNIGWNVADQRRKSLLANEHGTTTTKPGGIVDIFSLEMSKGELARRMLATVAEVPADVIKDGRFTGEDQADHVARVAMRVRTTPIRIDETGGLTLARLATKSRRLKRRRGMDLLIIDYLQLMGGVASKNSNRTQEITDITTGLKALAKELHIPIIALSQLSRKVEERSDKRPQLSDLRESGSIEQDADVVMFCYREEYYIEREKPDFSDSSKYSDWQARMTACHGKAEVIIAKQRHGPVGTVEMSWTGELTRFSDLARDAQ